MRRICLVNVPNRLELAAHLFQGSPCPFIIAGNELIGCMFPRTHIWPQQIKIFRFVTERGSAEIQKSSEHGLSEISRVARVRDRHSLHTQGRILSRKCPTLFAETVRINDREVRTNFLISETTKKRRITSSGSYITRGGVRTERSDPRAATRRRW